MLFNAMVLLTLKLKTDCRPNSDNFVVTISLSVNTIGLLRLNHMLVDFKLNVKLFNFV